MDLRPDQQEVFVSLSFPPELLENPAHIPADTSQVSTNTQSIAKAKGRPPVDVHERLNYYRKKWEAHRDMLRKKEQRRMRKVGDEDEVEANATVVIY